MNDMDIPADWAKPLLSDEEQKAAIDKLSRNQIIMRERLKKILDQDRGETNLSLAAIQNFGRAVIGYGLLQTPENLQALVDVVATHENTLASEFALGFVQSVIKKSPKLKTVPIINKLEETASRSEAAFRQKIEGITGRRMPMPA